MFKIGDKLLVVEGSNGTLLKGTIVTYVRHESANKIHIEENQYIWFTSRFILATELIKALI